MLPGNPWVPMIKPVDRPSALNPGTAVINFTQNKKKKNNKNGISLSSDGRKNGYMKLLISVIPEAVSGRRNRMMSFDGIAVITAELALEIG